MSKDWTRPRGQAATCAELQRNMNGHKMLIRKHERKGGVWKSSKRYHCYLDSKYIGDCSTLAAAKLCCVLVYQELCI